MRRRISIKSTLFRGGSRPNLADGRAAGPAYTYTREAFETICGPSAKTGAPLTISKAT